MLHLRLTCPAGRTDVLSALLTGADGTVSVTVARGVVVDDGSGPADVVEADLARESADHVLALLRSSGAYERGTVTMSELDMAGGTAITRAQDEAPGEGVDAVVWSQLVETTDAGATLSSAYLVFLVVAVLIASVGLLTDSLVLIVGAMVLGPDFTAIAALAVSLVDRDARRALRSVRTVLLGFAVAAGITAGAAALAHAAGVVPAAYLEGRRPLTLFITSADGWSLVVALLAGVAGTVSLTASKSSALVGVFISVTTVPAAAEIATAGVTGQGALAVGATEVLGLNVAAIVVAAVATLLVQRAAWARVLARRGDALADRTSAEPAGPGTSGSGGQPSGSSSP